MTQLNTTTQPKPAGECFGIQQLTSLNATNGEKLNWDYSSSKSAAPSAGYLPKTVGLLKRNPLLKLSLRVNIEGNLILEASNSGHALKRECDHELLAGYSSGLDSLCAEMLQSVTLGGGERV